MSHVASLELCKELYELSGWGDECQTWAKYSLKADYEVFIAQFKDRDELLVLSGTREDAVPAYDLGYLLRKLPPVSKIINCSNEKTQIYGALFPELKLTFHADTPEDAACKLAIALIKQGVIKV